MSPDIKIQFYVFDDQHFAIPFSMEKHPLWQPTVDLISGLGNCSVITQKTRKWKDMPRIIVLLAEMGHLHHGDTYTNIVKQAVDTNYPLRYIKDGPKGGGLDELRLRRCCPVIMIGTEDVMDLFAEEPGEALEGRTYQYRLNLDSRLKYWDSGIWHRYVPLDGRRDSETHHFAQRFKRVFEEMCDWWEKGLYSTYVALENLEFQTRVMLHSFVAEIGHHGHEDRVTPFKFHSETMMNDMADEILKALRENGLLPVIQWRLLLVDDYAQKKISCYKKGNFFPACKHTKCDLIDFLLNKGLEQEAKSHKTFTVCPPVVKSKKQAIGIIDTCYSMLKKETYDIILLDYLLGEGRFERSGREYGYDFLRELAHYFVREKPQKINQSKAEMDRKFKGRNEKDLGDLHKGPLGRFWIFPISSFPFAFADKLKQLGMDGYSDHWHLSDGGDPVCTPALFRYNFLNFIKQQIAECYLLQDSRIDFFNRFTNIQNGILWRDLVLNSIAQIHLRKSILENDETQQSLFAEKMLSFIRNDENYGRTLDGVKNFVINITDTPYSEVGPALVGLPIENGLMEILSEKSALFFETEKKLEEEIDKAIADRRTTFDFSGKHLRWLSPRIGELQNIRVLRLSDNLLTTLPKEMAKLKQLEKLDLSYNPINYIPKEIKELNKIEVLDLSGNRSDLPKYLGVKHEGIVNVRHLFTDIATWNQTWHKKIAVLYAPEDKDELVELRKRLKPLEFKNLISFWADDEMLAGKVKRLEKEEQLKQANIILLLVSSNFLASDDIQNIEIKIALSQQQEGFCQIVPIIFRECDWQYEVWSNFHELPKGFSAIYSSDKAGQDKAWQEVSEGIRRLITQGKLR